MPTVKVRNLQNKEVGDIELSDAVFGAELNEALIHAAVRNYLANGRQGTSATKTRGNVSGSGRKLWKQKGTGRARIASLRSPLWKGGGNVHGPQPRDWSYQMPKKMRRGALRSAISERLREGNLIIVEGTVNGAPVRFILTLRIRTPGGPRSLAPARSFRWSAVPTHSRAGRSRPDPSWRPACRARIEYARSRARGSPCRS